MAAYPHPALHIASIRKGDQEEAEDHAEYHVPKGEMRSAGSPDESTTGIQGRKQAVEFPKDF